MNIFEEPPPLLGYDAHAREMLTRAYAVKAVAKMDPSDLIALAQVFATLHLADVMARALR